jgi:hypothetical protein
MGSLATLGVSIGAGLTILGLLAGILVLVAPGPTGVDPQPGLTARWLRAAWIVMAFTFAGWAGYRLLRLLQALLADLFEQDSRRSRQFENGLVQATGLLDRIATNLEERGQPVGTFTEKASQDTVQDRLAALKAAREVNDPVRVLVLYEEIAQLLSSEDRGSLQSDIAQWFLTAIYRRLRAGKIQIEVVELATRFATSFAATTEGASVQAALPTLRRSAGLCPLCAQPYTGTAKACPECLQKDHPDSNVFAPTTGPISPEL